MIKRIVTDFDSSKKKKKTGKEPSRNVANIYVLKAQCVRFSNLKW